MRLKRDYYCPICGHKIKFPVAEYDCAKYIRDNVTCSHCGTFFLLCGDVNNYRVERNNYSLIWDVVKNA